MDRKIAADTKSPFDEDNQILDWQQSIIDLLDEEPDRRIIHWYYGKDIYYDILDITEHMIMEYESVGLCSPTANKANQQSIARYIKRTGLSPKMILFNLTTDKISRRTYQIIEEHKDAMFYVKGQPIIYKSPHVVVLSTLPPDTSMYSEGKLKIVHIE